MINCLKSNRAERRDEESEEAQGGGAMGYSGGAGARGDDNASNKSEADIKRERRWKNDNKAKVAHHNRKDLAARKNNFF